MTDIRRSPESVWRTPDLSSEALSSLEGEAAAEVAVIGAGFLGLFAALEIAEKGRSVVLLEAGNPADNASAASAGQIGPMILGGNRGPGHLIRKLGRKRGEMLARSIAGSGRSLFDRIEAHGINCDARRGYLCLSRSEKTLAGAAARFAEWRRFDGVAEPVGADEVRQSIASSRYAGGFFLPDGGMVDPAKLITGLIAALQAQGAQIFVRSPAVSIEGKGRDWNVHTPAGCVKARTVIVATGLGHNSPLPALAKAAYGVPCGLAATAPLGDLAAALLPDGGPAADLDDKAVFAPAITADGRLVVSFLSEQEPPHLPASAAPARKRLARAFPGEAIPPFETLSWGRIAITPDGLPRLFRTSEGIIAIGGCNGLGLTLGAVAAREGARLALGARPEELALPITAPRPLTGAHLVPKLFRSIAAPLANRMGV